MKKVIFLLEDNKTILYSVKQTLLTNKVVVRDNIIICDCNNISDANDKYIEYKDQIICMVCDSNMSSIGLSDILKPESKNGLFAGWLWLYDKIEKGDLLLLNKSIIYTAYFTELNKKIDKHPEQANIKEHIKFVTKKSVTSVSDDELVNTILQIIS